LSESQAFQIRVEKVQFSAAHFATFGNKCERLHGHSYEVAAQIDGSLTSDDWVFDFVKLKAHLRNICEELDHRFLLQTQSKLLRIESKDGLWQIETPDGASYSLPEADVVALPLENTTAELLARWVCEQLWKRVINRSVTNISAISIEVWEGPGQRATYEEKRLPLE
jgi:6-pyruvoyl tetrahydropterin synthase/QueD family protein